MQTAEIAHMRLVSQQIVGSNFNTAAGLVGWMGAIQAQDYPMCKWAIGLRVPGSSDQEVEAAVSRGEILRTHVLRPTWHIVPAENMYWMLDLTAPRLKNSLKTRLKELELTPELLSQSRAIIEKQLQDGQHLTREELMAHHQAAGIDTRENRSSHLLMAAELEQLICSGEVKNGKQTYALLAERVPIAQRLPKEEALAKLATAYFTSHAPAAVPDFVWWSGLTAGEAKEALELIKPQMVAEKVGSQIYWLPAGFSVPPLDTPLIHLLPAYDEFLISYTDRTASIKVEHNPKAFSNNGIFYPVMVVNGQVVGTWKRTIKKEVVQFETSFMEPPAEFVLPLVKENLAHYAQFLGKKIGVLS
jgi:hypothetical protein